MLYIFHGDNTTASRNASVALLDQLKLQQRGAEGLRLDGEKLTETDLLEALEASSLLGDSKIIAIDNLLSRRVSKEKDNLIHRLMRILVRLQPSPSLVLWESKSVTAAVLKKFSVFPTIKAQEFKLAKTLFRLLDAIRPGNNKLILNLFGQTLKTEAAELVFFMMAKRVTQLIIAKSGENDVLAAMLPADWQRSNVLNQASGWDERQLLSFHSRLLEIEELVKTGRTPADLRTHLDILLASL